MTQRLAAVELKALLRAQVAETGGAKNWLQLHKMFGFDHVLYMVENGDFATDERFAEKLGFRRVVMYEPISE